MSLTKVTYSLIKGASVNVLDYGAKGDGIANDTIAFINALAESSSIFIPDGTYILDSFVLFNSSTTSKAWNITGSSRNGTILKATSSTVKFLQITGQNSGGSYQDGTSLSNFTIDFTDAPNSVNSVAIYTSGAYDTSFSNMTVFKNTTTQVAVLLDSGTYTTSFTNCNFGADPAIIGNQGIIKTVMSTPGDQATTCSFTACEFSQAIVRNAQSITFINCTVQGVLTPFFDIDDSFSVRIIGCYNENFGAGGTFLKIGANAVSIKTFGNQFAGISPIYEGVTDKNMNGSLFLDDTQFFIAPGSLSGSRELFLYSTVNGMNIFRGGTDSSSNVAIGTDAMTYSTGTANTGVGTEVLYATTGGANTGMGFRALKSILAGGSNVAVGVGTLTAAISSDQCVAVGRDAGAAVTTGSNLTLIGYNANPSTITVNSEIVIGSGATGVGVNTAFIGGSAGAYNGANVATWATTSDERIKKNISLLSVGLDVILALDAVEFDYIETDQHDEGFIAQQYQKILPRQVASHAANDVQKTLVGGDEVLRIQQNLVPYIVKAIQELNSKFDAYIANHP